MLGLAGEALSSHEVPAGEGAASKSTCHIKGTLKLRGQLISNVRVDPFVGGMVVTRIAAATVEAQAGKEVGVPCSLPRAWSNDAISKDALHGNKSCSCYPGLEVISEGSGLLLLLEPRPFRYGVVAKSKVACFVPKKLDGDLLNLRPTQLGGVFEAAFSKLPKTTTCQVLWQVKCDQSCPAEVIPLKPKLWLCADTTLRAGCAHWLKPEA